MSHRPEGEPSLHTPTGDPSRARRDPLHAALFVLLAAVTLLPIWSGRHLPFTEWPALLARIALGQRLSDPSWHLADYYARTGAIAPGWAFYALARLVAPLLGVDGAARFGLSLGLVALPWSSARLARRFGRSYSVTLLAFPLSLSAAVGRGEASFPLALACALLALALVDGSLARGATRPGARLAGAALLAFAAFLLHATPFALFVALAPLVILAHAGRAPTARLVAAALACAVVLAIAAAVLVARAPLHVAELRELFTAPGAHEPAADALREAYRRVLITWPDRGDDLALIALALSWLLVATAPGDVADEADAGDRHGGATTLAAWVPEIGFLLVTLAYFLAPRRLDAFGDTRFELLPMAGLFGLLLVRGPVRRERRLLLLPGLVAALAYPCLLAGRVADFDARTSEGLGLLAGLPRATPTLLVHMGKQTDPSIDDVFEPWSRFHGYALVELGGDDPLLAYHDEPVGPRPAQRRACRIEPTPDDACLAATWSYVLRHAPVTAPPLFAHGDATLVSRTPSGTFSLFRAAPATGSPSPSPP